MVSARTSSHPRRPLGLLIAALSVLASTTLASPTPHEGHHGFPTAEFNATVVHSNESHPHIKPSASGHEHAHGHSTPLLVLNETQVLMGHAPDPLSYIAYDLFGERQGYKSGHEDDAFDMVVYSGKGHGWLITWHILATCGAFFVALPASIVLRSAKHALQPLIHGLFVGLLLLGWVTASAYRKVTPNLYSGSKHAPFGSLVILAALAVSAAEYVPKIVVFFRRFFAYVQRVSEKGGAPDIWEAVKIGRGEDERLVAGKEVVFEAGEWVNEPEGSNSGTSSPRHHHPHHPIRVPPRRSHLRQLSLQSDFSDATTLHNHSPTSMHSLEDLHEEEELYHVDTMPTAPPKPSIPARIWFLFLHFSSTLHFIWERLLVILGYIALVMGSVVYTGICRDNYLNGCLAHLIKGSIFFLYGLLTFARYLGAYSSNGWAWNRPTRKAPSAELVESFVIFLYGATNTWMERFGAEPGSPYTAKQIQHISIAVMYFFGGAIGMALELGAKGKESAGDEYVQQYRGSFNPFAAICIGITGVAMAAHHQTYLFQVEVHMLWGALLAFYSLGRCLTYFVMWLNPPRTSTPSRPPTEALASFALTCGGLAFISSTEQIGFWAMRSGRDDVMMFANVIVALCFLCFTWLFSIMAFRTWLLKPSESNSIANGYQRSSSDTQRRSTEEYELGPYGKVRRAPRH